MTNDNVVGVDDDIVVSSLPTTIRSALIVTPSASIMSTPSITSPIVLRQFTNVSTLM
ncbi:unnamed protein product [Musa acuminata subsp. malaccensis]|uniref:(wild Malaysian banana) hypothetical protein n=1 Tax=Musa acuminata subsp. malaccensis TaxID=214687 RepID=A0A804JAK1_MUSAM|nr:unnamed protein product [Musa acuminata subsp. malaccensis]